MANTGLYRMANRGIYIFLSGTH